MKEEETNDKEPLKVVADMTADLFHRGHVSFLESAKEYFGNRPAHLTVALHTDEQVLSFKGKLPIMDYECRKAVLESCRYVDKVVRAPDVFDNDFISKFDYLAHGDDVNNWEPHLVERYYGTAKKQNKLLLIPYTKGISSTQLKEIANGKNN